MSIYDAIIEIAQDASQEHSEQDLIKPLAPALGKQEGQKTKRENGDSYKNRSLPLADAKDCSAILNIFEMEITGDESIYALIGQVFGGQGFCPEIKG